MTSERKNDRRSGEQHVTPIIKSSPDRTSVVLAGGNYAITCIGERASEDVICMLAQLLDADTVHGPQPGGSVRRAG